MTITDFLATRILEDEQQANDRWTKKDGLNVVTVEQVTDESEGFIVDGDYLSLDDYRDRFFDRTPDACGVAECEAKRAILATHSHTDVGYSPGGHACPSAPWASVAPTGTFRDAHPCDTLRALATIYSDHPDYREEWAG